jgi:hypothetical protein
VCCIAINGFIGSMLIYPYWDKIFVRIHFIQIILTFAAVWLSVQGLVLVRRSRPDKAKPPLTVSRYGQAAPEITCNRLVIPLPRRVHVYGWPVASCWR